jgi:hypothetical protein
MKTALDQQVKYTHTGSSFADFLDEEGIRNEVDAVAIKRVSEWKDRTSCTAAKRQRRDIYQPRA